MDFFEKPRLVTAVVFFAQTIIGLLNMKLFLYHNDIFFLILFFGFPFAFYYTYKYIIEDLDKDKESKGEKIKVKWNTDDSDASTELPKKEHGKETFPKSEFDQEDAVVSVKKETFTPTSEPTIPQKNKQVVHTQDVFSEEEPEAEVPVHRPTPTQEASNEANTQPTEHTAVDTAETERA